jgi:NAD(P)-dependent dehydrogenase (short-subunit alcohol dehydrogenase family)
MQTILITGANRGLGLEFCRQYSEQDIHIIACCRNPDSATELQAIAITNPRLSIYALDVNNFNQIDALAQQLSDKTIDILLCNAGVYGDTKKHSFGALDYQIWEQTLRINTLAPVKLAESFLPNLLKSTSPKLIAMSSLMASISDNSSGGSICYRSSKAALNAAMKSLAINLKEQNIAVLILHPGWVKTDMGGSNAPLNTQDSIIGMRQVISDFNLSNSGAFLNYRGDALAW